MSQRSKKDEGKHRSEYYSNRYDHYINIGYTNGESSRLAHVDLAKEFKQKNPTVDKLKQIWKKKNYKNLCYITDFLSRNFIVR